jgi:hypothetical protein
MAPEIDPGAALSNAAENAIALARAEVRLALSEAKAWFIRIGLGLGLMWLGLMLAQVFVLVLALSPVLLVDRPWSSIAIMLAIALAPMAAAFLFAARELRSLKNLPPAAGVPGALEHSPRQAPEPQQPKRVGV